MRGTIDAWAVPVHPMPGRHGYCVRWSTPEILVPVGPSVRGPLPSPRFVILLQGSTRRAGRMVCKNLDVARKPDRHEKSWAFTDALFPACRGREGRLAPLARLLLYEGPFTRITAFPRGGRFGHT